MRTEPQIRKRIDEIITEMEHKKITMHPDNVLIYSDEVKNQLSFLNELVHLYWVLDERIPKPIFDLLRCDYGN